MAQGTIKKKPQWISYTDRTDAWGQIIIPANVVSVNQQIIAVKTIGCYAFSPMINNDGTNWVLTLVLNNGNLSLLTDTQTVVYLAVS